LHFADVKKLLKILHKLRDMGNTIIIIEHNLDVISAADWIMDLGPEGGENGGQIIASGPPKDIVGNEASHTAQYLKDKLSQFNVKKQNLIKI
jgi:excinuclease ABC subunit A